jgi:hypothetical protein
MRKRDLWIIPLRCFHVAWYTRQLAWCFIWLLSILLRVQLRLLQLPSTQHKYKIFHEDSLKHSCTIKAIKLQFEALHCWYHWWNGFIKYSMEMTWGGMVNMPNFMMIGINIQVTEGTKTGRQRPRDLAVLPWSLRPPALRVRDRLHSWSRKTSQDNRHVNHRVVRWYVVN